MSQAWSHVFLNLRHNSIQTKGRLVRMVDQNGGKFERFQNFQKRLHFIQIESFFSQKFIRRYTESDKKIKIWQHGHFKLDIKYANSKLTSRVKGKVNIREFKHDVYGKRKTTKMTSEFVFIPSNP